MTSWTFAATTDVGLVREVNEDSISVTSSLAIVADGMGGHAAGEVASALAVTTIETIFGADHSESGLLRSVSQANSTILDDAQRHPERSGMGTTVVVLGLVETNDGAIPMVVNVGDSRAYQLRDGALKQITKDHSVAEEWVRQGRLTPEEAAVHPKRHQLTRTLGISDPVRADVFTLDVVVGDRVLLCSDGLSNELSDTEIAALSSEPHSLDQAVTNLLEGANTRGGRDNISVVLVQFDEVNAPVEPEPVMAVPAAAVGAVAVGAASASGHSSVTVAEPVVVEETESARPTPTYVRRRKKRVTWRSILFVLVFGALIGAAVYVVNWYAKSNYYLADKGRFVVVYQGVPGGILWHKPVFVKNTGVLLVHLPADRRAIVHATYPVNSVAAGVALAKYWNSLYLASLPGATTTTTIITTTTTTTTVPVTSTTQGVG